jgi:hypothetical protein
MNARTSFGLVTAAVAFTLGACSGGGESAKPPAASPEAAAPAASTGTTAAAATPAGAEFGVPECDDYLKKYMECIDSKVPEAGRAMMRQSIEQTKAQWQKAAATPEGKSALATGCKAASDAAKTAVAAYGCTW